MRDLTVIHRKRGQRNHVWWYLSARKKLRDLRRLEIA